MLNYCTVHNRKDEEIGMNRKQMNEVYYYYLAKDIIIFNNYISTNNTTKSPSFWTSSERNTSATITPQSPPCSCVSAPWNSTMIF